MLLAFGRLSLFFEALKQSWPNAHPEATKLRLLDFNPESVVSKPSSLSVRLRLLFIPKRLLKNKKADNSLFNGSYKM